VIHTIVPGDFVLLTPGVYTDSCDMTTGPQDLPGEFTTLMPYDSDDPPIFRPDGATPYVMRITGEYATVFGARFEDIPAGVTAVLLRDAQDMTVHASTFVNVDGRAVGSEGRVDRLSVWDVAIDGGSGIGIEFGCPTGCEVNDFEVSFLFTDGLASPLVAHPGAEGFIDRALIVRAETGVVLAGGGDSLMTESFVSSTGTALEITGGPQIVRSSILASTDGVAIQASGGQQRLLGNTAWSGVGTGLVRADWTAGSELINNALGGDLPAALANTTDEANVACTDECWIDPAGWDFYPPPDSPIRAEDGVDDFDVLADWCGFPRDLPPTIGAFEAIGDDGYGPVEADFRFNQSCGEVDGGTDTGAPTGSDTGTAGPGYDGTDTGTGGTGQGPNTDADAGSDTGGVGDSKEGTGCGCATSGSGGLAPAALLPLLLIRRRHQ